MNCSKTFFFFFFFSHQCYFKVFAAGFADSSYVANMPEKETLAISNRNQI